MKRRVWVAAAIVVLALVAAAVVDHRAGFAIRRPAPVGRQARIRPGYADTAIPPNIAPLNFLVDEPGTHYRVDIRGAGGRPITVLTRSGEIVIPPGPWADLLRGNRGQDLQVQIHVRQPSAGWQRYAPITITVAPDEIDGFLVYRSIAPMYCHFAEAMVMHERSLATYDESVIMHNQSLGNGCVNCHAFHNNSPERMTLGLRPTGGSPGTLIASDGAVTKLGAKFGYTSWHPSGRLVAYSLNKVEQFVHFAGQEMRGVVDRDSDIVYYEIGATKVKTSPAISHPDRLETFPAWSPDGRYLYFSSGPVLWPEEQHDGAGRTIPWITPPLRYDEALYDLMRIAYNVDTDTWGELETVVSSEETGQSALLPRISPDGRYLLFTMCKYGCFPIALSSSDLYLMELETGKYRPLDINSKWAESWHSWSSNSRWFAFSSKRRDGFFSRIYLSYVDENGKAHKPVLVPEEDPAFYESFLRTRNTPELITASAAGWSEKLLAAHESPDVFEVTMPSVSMTQREGVPMPAPLD